MIELEKNCPPNIATAQIFPSMAASQHIGLCCTACGAHIEYERFLRLPEVKALTGLGRSTIYERMNEGKFPHSISLGGKAVAWAWSEVVQWIENQKKQHKLGKGGVV